MWSTNHWTSRPPMARGQSVSCLLLFLKAKSDYQRFIFKWELHVKWNMSNSDANHGDLETKHGGYKEWMVVDSSSHRMFGRFSLIVPTIDMANDWHGLGTAWKSDRRWTSLPLCAHHSSLDLVQRSHDYLPPSQTKIACWSAPGFPMAAYVFSMKNSQGHCERWSPF